MTPPIQYDERVWQISIKSDSCPFTFEDGINESCRLLYYKNEKNLLCTLENCPKRVEEKCITSDEVGDIVDQSVEVATHSPCFNCTYMRDYFPACQENCGISKPARYT